VSAKAKDRLVMAGPNNSMAALIAD
jgi:hypothetical protein